MTGVLHDGEAQVELGRQRSRYGERFHRRRDHCAAKALYLRKVSLQLHELRLTRPSAGPLVEIEHHLGTAQPGERELTRCRLERD